MFQGRHKTLDYLSGASGGLSQWWAWLAMHYPTPGPLSYACALDRPIAFKPNKTTQSPRNAGQSSFSIYSSGGYCQSIILLRARVASNRTYELLVSAQI